MCRSSSVTCFVLLFLSAVLVVACGSGAEGDPPDQGVEEPIDIHSTLDLEDTVDDFGDVTADDARSPEDAGDDSPEDPGVVEDAGDHGRSEPLPEDAGADSVDCGDVAAGPEGCCGRIHVDCTEGSDTGPCGLTVETACKTIQRGIDRWAETNTCVVVVETGTCVAAEDDPTVATFTPISHLRLLGGFCDDFASRDIEGCETVVDGTGEDHIAHTLAQTDILIDGFTFRNGGRREYDDTHRDQGGAMYNMHVTDMTVSRCRFENNGTSFGGAIYGRRNVGVDFSLTIDSCVFVGNSAVAKGGAIFNQDVSPEIVNCLFVENTTITALSNGVGGGAIYNDNSTSRVINSTFVGNSSTIGGAIVNDSGSFPLVLNSLFHGNTATALAPEIWVDEGEATIVHSSFDSPCAEQGCWVNSHLGGTCTCGDGNISGDPLFRVPDEGNFRLGPSSPCIDAGVDVYEDTTAPSHDLDGDARPLDGDGDLDPVHDIGAYELGST